MSSRLTIEKLPISPYNLQPEHAFDDGQNVDLRIGGKSMDETTAEILKLKNQVCFPLYAASRLVVQAYRPLLADLGLTYPQYLVMLVLWEEEGVSVGYLGERLYLDSGTLTPLLKRLEKQGLVERKRSAQDDRTVENWLTDEGRSLKESAVDIPTELVCNAQLEDEHLGELKTQLHELLDKLLVYHGVVEAPPAKNE
jgi:DNA-binding MarR family transcriptional regulator